MIHLNAPLSKQPFFEPVREAALTQLNKINPERYERTRNFLNGEVTFLSPWITHGFLSTKECAKKLQERHKIEFDSKLISELGWREFFRHVHQELGDAIFRDIQPPPWDGQYAHTMPLDIIQAQTGIPVIDDGVKHLYSTGYLHNHLRMWIASYVVHIRKVNWRTGAYWMYGYLLDGELASNYLSWQWIAGTFSHKPYVFNAENVQKYASWLSCTNTQIDRDYEALDDIARNQADLGPEAFITSTPVPVPELFYEPVHFKDVSTLDLSNKVQLDEAKNWARVQKNIRLINPWDLGKPHQGKSQVGVIDLRFHEKHPWSQQRWEFVLNGMHKVCEQIWVLNTTGIANTKQILKVTQSLGGHVSIDESLNPAYRGLPALLNIQGVPSETLLPEPPYFQQSFSKFYKKTTQMAGSLDALF